jgi:hypothetical protein
MFFRCSWHEVEVRRVCWREILVLGRSDGAHGVEIQTS